MESNSDDCEIDIIAAPSMSRKFYKRQLFKKKKTHREFTLKDRFSDEKHKNYYRTTCKQFSELHGLIKEAIQVSSIMVKQAEFDQK